MPYITQIETNFKGKDRVIEIQHPHIAVVGNNASGKTALVNAITLPITGVAGDLGAREEGKAAEMLRYLAPDHSRAYSRLTFSDGSKASWEVRSTGKPEFHPPEFAVSTPFDDAFAMLKGSRETVIKYFVKNFGPTDRPIPGFGVYAGMARGKPWYIALPEVEAEASKVARAHKATMSALEKSAEAAFGWDISKGYRTAEPDAMQALYNTLVAQHKAATKVADEAMSDMAAWFDSARLDLGRALRSDPMLSEVGIVYTKSQALVGLRRGDVIVDPLISGAQTMLLALKLCAHARRDDYGMSLVVMPDRDYDDRTKWNLMEFTKNVPINTVLQTTRLPPGPLGAHWSVVNV